MGAGGWDEKLQANALLGEFADKHAGVRSTTFWGYVGPSPSEDVVILHSSLQDVGDTIEIPREAIVHVEDVPETVLLFGAKVLWVRSDAKVVRRQTSDANLTGAPGTASSARPAPAADPGVERNVGRLHLRMADQVAEDCVSPCATCRDCSSVCISICRYVPPAQ